MSTNKYKTCIRFQFEGVIHDDRMQEILNGLDLEFTTWNDASINEVSDQNWDVYFGTRTGEMYLDYIIAENEYDDPFFDGVISVADALNIRSKVGAVAPVKAYKICSYGYYTGTDEPEIF